MSWRAIITFAVVVLLIGGGWLGYTTLFGEKIKPRESGPVFEFERSALQAVTVAMAGEDARRFVTTRDGWSEVLEDGNAVWAIETGRLQSFLRGIEAAEIDAGFDPSMSDPIVFMLEGGGDEPIIGEMSASAIAGQVRVRAEDGAAASVDAGVLNAITRPTPDRWRIRRVFPNLDTTEVSRVRLETEDGAIQLNKVGNRWSMLEPARARADERAVLSTVNAIARQPIAAFEPLAPSEIDRAGLSVVLEIDHQRLEGERVISETETLRVDLEGLEEGSRARHSGLSRTKLILGPAPTISLDPSHFLDAKALGLPGDSFHGLIVRQGTGKTHRYQRTLDGWAEESVESEGSGIDLGIRAMLDLLANRPADVGLISETTPADVLASVDFLGIDGEPLAMLQFGRTADRRFVAMDQAVLWTYEGGVDAPEILDLDGARTVSEAGDPDQPAPGDPGDQPLPEK